MPYKHEKHKKKIPKNRDRRIVLTDEIKKEITMRHQNGESIRSMSRMFEIDRRTIDFYLFPEKLEENKLRRKERGGSKVYYDKDKHKESMKSYRQYKKVLDTKDLLEE